mgnify:CR=1 FL=1
MGGTQGGRRDGARHVRTMPTGVGDASAIVSCRPIAWVECAAVAAVTLAGGRFVSATDGGVVVAVAEALVIDLPASAVPTAPLLAENEEGVLQ